MKDGRELGGPALALLVINVLAFIISITVGVTIVNVVNGDAAAPAWSFAVAFAWAAFCSLAPWGEDD